MPLLCAFMRGFRDGIFTATVEGYGYQDEVARVAGDVGLTLGSAVEQRVSTIISKAHIWTDHGTLSCIYTEM